MTHVSEDLKPHGSTRQQVNARRESVRWSVEIAATICVLIVSASDGRYLNFHACDELCALAAAVRCDTSRLRRTITTLADDSSRHSGRDHIVAKRMGDD